MQARPSWSNSCLPRRTTPPDFIVDLVAGVLDQGIKCPPPPTPRLRNLEAVSRFTPPPPRPGIQNKYYKTCTTIY